MTLPFASTHDSSVNFTCPTRRLAVQVKFFRERIAVTRDLSEEKTTFDNATSQPLHATVAEISADRYAAQNYNCTNEGFAHASLRNSCEAKDYSARSASTGFTEAARCAGT
jgi:hypothetical protein